MYTKGVKFAPDIRRLSYLHTRKPTTPNPDFDSPLRRTKAFTERVPRLKIRV